MSGELARKKKICGKNLRKSAEIKSAGKTIYEKESTQVFKKAKKQITSPTPQ